MKKVTIQLKKVKTGEIVEYLDEYEDDYSNDSIEFMWEEGNYSCDCNRELFWRRSKNLDEIDTKCGDERFKANVLLNGEYIYQEFNL